MTLLPMLNFTLSVGGLALAGVTIVLFVDYFIYRGKYFGERVREGAWPIVTGVTIGTVAMTLVYSEYFKFVPCSMCWLQRVALYPQALMSVLAFSSGDTKQFPTYGIWLSGFGLIVAIYQYIYQLMPAEAREGFAPCLIDGSNADCAVKVMNEFGFVTFPLLSAVSFAFLIVVYLYMRRG